MPIAMPPSPCHAPRETPHYVPTAHAIATLHSSQLTSLRARLYAYLAINPWWKSVMRATTDDISSSGGRKVVRKCHVPSF